jgi:hypothetical protein
VLANEVEKRGVVGILPMFIEAGGGFGAEAFLKPCCIEGGGGVELPRLVVGGFLETPDIPDP